jgi:hypothetical protein
MTSDVSREQGVILQDFIRAYYCSTWHLVAQVNLNLSVLKLQVMFALGAGRFVGSDTDSGGAPVAVLLDPAWLDKLTGRVSTFSFKPMAS